MPLLNHTTVIDADKTAQEISKMLSRAGAKAVMTEYDQEDQLVKSISFKISLNGNDISFRLPCDWHPVQEVLAEQKQRNNRVMATREQAVRTAWRIVKDWVAAQLALIETRMVKTEQVFLPYAIMKGDQTLYEKMANSNFMLGDGSQ